MGGEARATGRLNDKARLTRGMDIDRNTGLITARWERVRDGCTMKVAFTLRPVRSMTPLEMWDEIRPIADEFVRSVAYGPQQPIPEEEEIIEGEWRLLLEGA